MRACYYNLNTECPNLAVGNGARRPAAVIFRWLDSRSRACRPCFSTHLANFSIMTLPVCCKVWIGSPIEYICICSLYMFWCVTSLFPKVVFRFAFAAAFRFMFSHLLETTEEMCVQTSQIYGLGGEMSRIQQR